MEWKKVIDGDLVLYDAVAQSPTWRKLGFELKKFWEKLAEAVTAHCPPNSWNRLAVEMWVVDGFVKGYPYQRGLQTPVSCIISVHIPLVLAESDKLDPNDPKFDFKIQCVEAKLRSELSTGFGKARDRLIKLGESTDFTIWVQSADDREHALEFEVC